MRASVHNFGKYQLFARLGAGGMAEVLLAVAHGPMGFSKLAVVKRLLLRSSEDPRHADERIAMFLDEARLAARLNHPNVVQTYEVGAQDGQYFIAMEYLEGQSLNKVMRALAHANKRLTPAMCARIVSDALGGLHYAHELADYDGRPLQIIHRDIAPDNMFVTYDGQIKLVDFGVAKAAQAARSATPTEVGVVKGKLAYMAPEQAMGGAIDRRADLFAMGSVLWELLAGKGLIRGAESNAAMFYRLMVAPIPPVSSVVPVDPALEAIVTKALAREPGERFQTAKEMRDALEAWLAGTGVVVRHEEIGHLAKDLFKEERAEVERSIQRHMAVVPTLSVNAERSGERMRHRAPSTFPPIAPIPIEELEDEPTEEQQIPSARSPLQAGVLPNIGGAAENASPVGSGVINVQGRGEVEPASKPGRGRSKRFWVLGIVLLLSAFIGVIAQKVTRVDSRSGAREPVTARIAEPSALLPLASATALAPAASPALGTSNASPHGVAPVEMDEPASTAAPPSTSTAMPSPPAAGHASRRSTKPRASAPAAPPTPTAAAPAPPAPDPGSLTIDSIPWTKVFVDGRPLGNTPIIDVALPAGTHQITLDRPDEAIHVVTSVTIRSGEPTRRRFDLRKE